MALAALFAADGHEAHSVVQQALGGQPDERVIDVCRREQRALITLDLDFSNILTRPWLPAAVTLSAWLASARGGGAHRVPLDTWR
jgi:predicted nuclease of predicted toxin-antitoxin system